MKESAEEPGTKGVVFELGLLAGRTEVRTWLYDWDRKDGAAYFIEVELL